LSISIVLTKDFCFISQTLILISETFRWLKKSFCFVRFNRACKVFLSVVFNVRILS